MALSDVKLKFSLDSSGVTKVLNSTKASIKDFASSAVSKFGLLAGAAGFGALTSSALRYASEMKELIKISGSSNEEFQRMAAAAKTVNIEQDKLADIFKDTNDKIGDFLQTGAGPMVDFFEQIAPKVGATREEFIGLSGPQALQRYYDYLQRANLSQQDMTFFMEAIASDATALIPLLHDGGEGFRALGEGAAIMDQETIEALDSANDHIQKFQQWVTIKFGGVIAFVLNKVVPVFSILGTTIAGAGVYLKTLTAGFRSSLLFIGNAVKQTIQPVLLQFKSLALGLKAVAMSFADPKKALETFKESLSLQKKSFKSLLDVPSAIAKEFAITKNAMDMLNDDMEKDFNTKGESIKKNWADVMSKRVVEAKKANDKLKSMSVGGGADKNKSGFVTPREQRAYELEQEAANRDKRRKQLDEMAAEAGADERAREKARDARMAAKARAAGIDTGAGIESMAPGAGSTGKGAANTSETELVKQTTLLETIKTELTT